MADLVYASLDSSGRTVPRSPVTNRPWDWVESLGDIAPSKAPTDGGIRNNPSLSLELFAARAAVDNVRSEKNARGFHDALSGIGQRPGYRSQTRHRPGTKTKILAGSCTRSQLRVEACLPHIQPGLAKPPNSRGCRARRSSRSRVGRPRDLMNPPTWSDHQWAAGSLASATRRRSARALISK